MIRPRPPEQTKPGLMWGDPHKKRRRGCSPEGVKKPAREPPGPVRTLPAPAVTPAGPTPRPARPGSPALAGSGAPRAQPGQLLGGRPGPLRAHSQRRAAGPGPLGTILAAAPGAASGSAGPARGPEATADHAAETRDSLDPAAVVSG